jgi:hypothetical protein
MACGFRDGSAVELVGLCKSVVHWLCELNNKGHYKNKGVMVQFGDKSKTNNNDTIYMKSFPLQTHGNLHLARNAVVTFSITKI